MGVQWTADQQKVIKLRERNILVSAAAGSGKTAVLVERILTMITSDINPMDIDRLLIVTFTNAAAAEMRERIGLAIEKRLYEQPNNEHLQRQATLVHHAQITTIHSFCLHVIRNYFDRLEIDPSFRIGDDGELMLLKADVMGKLLEDYYEEGSEEFKTFIESYSSGKTDKGIEDYILMVYRFATSNPWPKLWLDQCQDELAGDTLEEMKQAPWMLYLMNDVGIQMEELLEQSAYGMELCQEEDGPFMYLPMFQSDQLLLLKLKEAEDYETLNKRLLGIKFDRLSSKKSNIVTQEKREDAAAIRDRIKKSIGKLKELYCFEDILEVPKDIAGSRKPIAMLITLTKEFMERYQEAKKKKNIVDFNDLEHYALTVLVKQEDGRAFPTDVAMELSYRYHEILIDEYQDSNLVQEMLLNSISKERLGCPNMFMVGDVKQSIYKFRLARPELFMKKYKEYTTSDSLYQKIELHQNFRSRSVVLSSINNIFYQIMTRQLGNIAYTEEVALHPGAEYPEVESITDISTELLLVNTHGDLLKELDDENADYTSREIEAKLIANQIHQLTNKDTGLLVWDKKINSNRIAEYRDMVILLRSINGWAEVFMNVLMNEGIPAFAQSQTGYFTTIEVQTILSLLTIIDNPIQDIPLTAVFKSPMVGLLDEELAYLIALFKRAVNKGEDRGIYGAWRYFLTYYVEKLKVNEKNNRKEEALYHKLFEFNQKLKSFSNKAIYLSLHELLYEVFAKTGYYDYVMAMPAGETRKANLDMLVEKAIAYESTSYQGLFHFIRYIEKLQKYDTDFGEASTVGENDNTVRIMSIHKSKGLEFPIVFLAGMSKQFNRQDGKQKILIDPELGIAADYMNLEQRVKSPTLRKRVFRRRMELENLGEELRILYVAMTRAKEKLIMTATDRNLDTKLERRSKLSTNGKGLPFTILSTANTYLDWLLMCAASSTNEVLITEVLVGNLVGSEVGKQARLQITKDNLRNFEEDLVYDQEFRELISERLSFQYPYLGATKLHTKMTVSELKKWGQEIDYEETELLPILPRFITQEEVIKSGTTRGTAYHRTLELISPSEIQSESDVKRVLEELLDRKKINQETYDLVESNILWGFYSSSLANRMRAAEKHRLLFKETQFVMGIPAKEIEQTEDDELVLVQGIVDAYFEEDGRLVLVDYKTDRINSNQEYKLVESYKTQLEYYEKALEQMTGKKVIQKIIYSLSLQKEVIIE